MTGIMVALGPCWVHKGIFEFHPDFVVSVLVDPQTGLPPDLRLNDETGEYDNIEPDPEALDRSVAKPICAECCKTINQETGTDLDERDSMDRALEEMR